MTTPPRHRSPAGPACPALLLLSSLCLVAAKASAGPASTPTASAPALAHVQRPPRAPSPGRPPLLVLLHGMGADERDLLPIADRLDPRFAVVSARAPLALPGGGYAWLEVQRHADGTVDFSDAQIDEDLLRLRLLVEEGVSATGADPRRVYVLGFSQGASMALAMALTMPDRVAGAVVMSGRLLALPAARQGPKKRLRGLSLLVIHGTEDRMIGVEHGRAIRDALAALPVAATYREFAMGHKITPETIALADAWLRERLAAAHDRSPP